MKELYTIRIYSNQIDNNELAILNEEVSSREVKFTSLKNKTIGVSPEFIIVIYELVKNIGASSVYDIMKYTLLKLLSVLEQRKKNQSNFIRITYGDKKSEIELSFDLSENQKDMLIEAAICKLLEENQ